MIRLASTLASLAIRRWRARKTPRPSGLLWREKRASAVHQMQLEHARHFGLDGSVNLPPPDASSLRLISSSRGRTPRAVASLFFLVNGIIFGTWATLLPSFKLKFALNEVNLSIALLGMVVGALVAMPIAGQIIQRHGSRAALTILAPGFCGTLGLLVMAPGFVSFVAAAIGFGAFKGGFDVSINSQGIAIENQLKKPIISTFQALWSIGGLVAALIVSVALKSGIAPTAIGITAAGLMAALVLARSRNLLGGDASAAGASSAFQLPNGRLLRIGILASMALFAEGVMMDWSAVYSRTVAGAAPWLAPMAYGVYSCCMAVGRLAGDWLVSHCGPAAILRSSGILTSIGLGIMVSIHHWLATFGGLACIGFGLANLVPILLSAGGRSHPDGVGRGVATVSMMGYLGFLVGPPVIGGIGQLVGLPSAFLLVIAFSSFIALCGTRLLGDSLAPAHP
jgi:MFS family permease